MKVLFDTHIILDVLLDRKPFADHFSLLILLWHIRIQAKMNVSKKPNSIYPVLDT